MSTKNRFASLTAVGLLALVVGLAVGYFIPHPTSNPAISLSTTSVSAGTAYTATLTGFPASTDIYGWVVNENPPHTFKAGTTDAQGTLTLQGQAPTVPGTWLLCASDANNEYWVEAVLTVT